MGSTFAKTETALAPPRKKTSVLQKLRQSCDVGSVLLIAIIAIGGYNLIQWSRISTLDFGIIVDYGPALAKAAGMTLSVTAVALAFGLLIGVGLAVFLELPIGPFRYLIIAHIEVWRNTPLIVQLFWVHFGMPALTGISTTAIQSGVIALTLQSSAYLADIASGGIRAVPQGQWDAIKALALPGRTGWLQVILPQALKIMIPPLGNLAVSFLNGSALLGLLSVGELMTVATRISNFTSKPVEVMSIVALLYLLINLFISYLTNLLERFSGHRHDAV